jgi:uncharacterized membrane protein
MPPRLAVTIERLRSAIWPVPAAMAVGAMLLSAVTLSLDHARPDDAGSSLFLYGGDAESARSLLGAIASALLTFTGLVFSVTMLVLQLASSQLSPRVMRTFLQDRGNQVVLGVFVGTLVYAMLTLRAVRSPPDAFVPGLSIWVALLLLLGSVAAFIYYIHHMANAIRATQVMDRVAAETRTAIGGRYPDPIGEQVPIPLAPRTTPTRLVRAHRSGSLEAIDVERLVGIAEEGDARLEVAVPVGGWVAAGTPLVRVWAVGDAQPADGPLQDALSIVLERTVAGDPGFGIRQLVDIALRALSPGVNDPTTAIGSIDRIHSLLRDLVGRAIPGPGMVDPTGRVVVHRPTWDDYVGEAVDEIERAAGDQPRVRRRIAAMLDDLLLDAHPARRAALRRRRALVADADPIAADAGRSASRVGGGETPR